MKYQYEKIVRIICGDNWNSDQVPLEETDGGLGVAMCLAYMQKPMYKITDFADAIGCPPFVIEVAYKRLQINGVFSPHSTILKDSILYMNNAQNEEDYNRSLRAWCHLAALAAGFIGKGTYLQSRNTQR